MLNVVNDQLVVESKGIYSIEKFLVARRLMYWQVYLHKAVVSAETMLVKILQRAKEIAEEGGDVFCSPSLHTFIYNNYGRAHFAADPKLLDEFSNLDDYDIMGAIKVWQTHSDPTLAKLSSMLVNRKLLKIEIQAEPITAEYQKELVEQAAAKLGITEEAANYFVISDSVKNNLYDLEIEQILIYMKNGEVKDIATASDDFNVRAVAKQVTKYFVCYPK
jgi:HD superfamily phosphohydrolase